MEITLETLGINLAKFRNEKGVAIRQAAQEIGTSPTTLTRIEKGNIPDIETFKKICNWMDADPGAVLNSNSSSNIKTPTVAVHFRKPQTLKPEIASALANMLILAQNAMVNNSFILPQEVE
jgi:transcriptional regulator with XRE-family HTH domain